MSQYNSVDKNKKSKPITHSVGSSGLKRLLIFFSMVGVAIATFAPIWEVDGFPGKTETGWKVIEKYAKKKKHDKEGADRYRDARENIKKLKEAHQAKQDSIKQAKQDSVDNNTSSVDIDPNLNFEFNNADGQEVVAQGDGDLLVTNFGATPEMMQSKQDMLGLDAGTPKIAPSPQTPTA